MKGNSIIYLNVKTVPAFDPVTHMPHTAYTIFSGQGEISQIMSGWTLQDAVRFYREIYNIDEQTKIRFKRPFKPQHILLRVPSQLNRK